MGREKRGMEEMLNNFVSYSHTVRMLGGIVQNEGHKPTDEELQEWSDVANEIINKINSLREDVVRFYQD